MSEEAKLRAKYGGALPRQQNMLTKKLLNKVTIHRNIFSLLIFVFSSRNISIPEIIMLQNHKVN
jgi:hypothetical protein